MIGLIGELDTASSLLQVAVDRYLNACSAIQNYYTQTTTLTGVPRALSDRVSNELLLVASYEVSIKQAKSVIGHARNCSAAVPIHSLPSEILIRIFHLALSEPCCAKAQGKESTSLPRYPDFLSHVCSRWRQIVLSLPVLWSHVDLVYRHSLGEGFAARAEVCAARAGDLPLDIHIRMPPSCDDSCNDGLYDFLESTATRARSLELAIPSTMDHIPEPLFEACFDFCVPGTLVELAITDHGRYTPDFIVALEDFDDDTDPEGLCLCLSEQHFEELLLRVTKLRLDGLYPPWTSPAYHGLVELRLMSAKRFSISESDLYGILESSPGLRILQFGLHIHIEGLSLDTAPVRLEDLEVLNLGTLDYNQLATVLSLVSAGPKPLQLTIKYSVTMSLNSKDEVTEFFKHSNITKLQLKGSDQFPRTEIFPILLPQLQILVLDGFINKQKPRSQSHPPRGDADPRALPLNVIYILNSRLDLDSTARMVKGLRCPVQAIVFWRSDMSRNGKFADENVVKGGLSKFCSVIEQPHWSTPNPLRDWV